MNATLVAVVLSLFSAVAYAAAAVAQERLASRAPETGLVRLMVSGAWWASVGLNGSAALLHVVALKYGPLTVVQPLGALTLVAAVPLGARVAGRKVSAVEWRGTALTLLGLAAILVTASGPAPDDVLSTPEALGVAGTTAVLIGLLARPGTRPGLRHATASGFASGVASALTQTVTVAATDRSGPLLSVQVIGVALLVAALAVGGLFLSQTAYRGGLDAPLAVVTLTNPVAAALIGLLLLGERLQGGVPGMLLALAGAGLAARGVILLTRVAPEHQPVAAQPEEDHPVAAVLALEPGTASVEPALVSRRPEVGRAVRGLEQATASAEPALVRGRSEPGRAVRELEPATASAEPALVLRRPEPRHAVQGLEPATAAAEPGLVLRRPEPRHAVRALEPGVASADVVPAPGRASAEPVLVPRQPESGLVPQPSGPGHLTPL